MSGVETFFRFCPSCGKRFHIRLVGKKLLGEHEEKAVETHRHMVGTGAMYHPLTPLVLDEEVPIVVDVKDFSYSYRCKHCGHTWSEEHKTETKA